jgi:lysophospholipase
MPLRGELTRPTVLAPNRPTTAPDLPSIQGLLAQFVRLTSSARQMPQITLSPSVGDDAQHAAAGWTGTATETASTEAALLPLLMHLAAARNDVGGLNFCIATAASWEVDDVALVTIPGGIVNCLEVGSGRSPLHVAALNGSTASVSCLLESGALVHLRDALGHTALYYVSTFQFDIRHFGDRPTLGRRLAEDTRTSWTSSLVPGPILGVWSTRLDMRNLL